MSLLVDTHALLWFVAGDRRLSFPARTAIESPEEVLWVSMACWWELAIKASLERIRFDPSFEDFLQERMEEGFRPLPIELEHVRLVRRLPFHHRDPFDRLLVAQAMAVGFPIVSADRHFARYGVEVIW